jgi:ketosteroid isomerase-like protein
MRHPTILCLLTCAFMFSVSNVRPGAQAPATASVGLREEIARADAAMFDAFNAHDLDETGRWFAPDLEFYHDKDGALSYAQVMEGFRKLFAQNNGIKRELLKDSLEVYPIKDYGAIETGSHRFCHVENGHDECGQFKFVLVWRQKDGRWQVARALSYDHKL